jgi:hypothetical protein
MPGKYYAKGSGKDHVLVNITLSVMIGVEEEEDDAPREFCNMVRECIKETGAVILASSIVGQKRLHYKGSSREEIFKASGIQNNPLDNEQG